MGVAGAGVEAGVAAEVAVPTNPLVFRRPPGRYRSELPLSQFRSTPRQSGRYGCSGRVVLGRHDNVVPGADCLIVPRATDLRASPGREA